MHILNVMIGYLFIKINTVQLQVVTVKQFTGPGSTPNLEEIVLGRCYDYTETVNPSVGKKNCSEIWEALKMAFVHKDPCSVFPSDYELYINLTLHKIPANKSLFWENNKDLVHRYSDRTKRYMPLGDTLSGWLADNLNWCGTANDPGIEYKSCPTTAECEHNAMESFWRIASVNYAKQSSGEVQIMLNSSTPGGAFPIPSFLADFEIPNFEVEKISRVNIWVMDDIGGGDINSCGRDSVAVLEDMLAAKHLSHRCTDNYRPVKILQCVDFPSHEDCATNSGNAPLSLWVITILPWLGLTINHSGLIVY
ncbi:ADP-ribosyl cyclase/cyclic ADP-ribose hydrolase 2-like [Spea bombifrons]|uniref:ADP-ribosyl cyclase/cyclic ADP-ribose hydrolase 2-like n=1 Tax=Spea bombifrons TaxID=233779 RepID=UPI00234ABF23|nr:ADP-ribosyl cyclase/cyclic ADP-ribose hydrolase 2-like [Spea bombifrons]